MTVQDEINLQEVAEKFILKWLKENPEPIGPFELEKIKPKYIPMEIIRRAVWSLVIRDVIKFTRNYEIEAV